MARLKLNLTTGAVVEKPVVTCFSVDSKTYLVLDAENIGSMGLPIILVCKIDNNKVIKISDAAEWQQAKDYLKGIIAGNSMNYCAVTNEMAADEVYYTQLTLPVASFDLIKNNYKVESLAEPTLEPVIESVPKVEPVVESPVSEIPVINIDVTPEPQPTEDVPSAVPDIPVIETPAVPVIDENIVQPVIPETPSVPEPINNEMDFSESKEAFMKACENMFDALVSKFQAELDSKK